MHGVLIFLLLGLGAGAVYAALALGIVLTYQGAGIINFAFGAIAMYPTYVYADLRSTGRLELPWLGIPSTITFGSPLGLWPALVIGLLVAAGLGVAVHFLVFRPLRDAPALAKVVGSVGVIVVLESLAVIKFGTANLSVPSVLPTDPVHLLGVTVSSDRLYLTGLVIAVAVLLAALYRLTRFGLATRASAEN